MRWCLSSITQILPLLVVRNKKLSQVFKNKMPYIFNDKQNEDETGPTSVAPLFGWW